MAGSAVAEAGGPIPTSAMLTASWRHIGERCHGENVEFLKCKKEDGNPEKCIDKGNKVTRCVFGLLRDLHQRCTKEMDSYAGCMYYHTNEFDLCRKEQEAFCIREGMPPVVIDDRKRNWFGNNRHMF